MAALFVLAALAMALAGYHYYAALALLKTRPADAVADNALRFAAALPRGARRHYVMHLAWGNGAAVLLVVALAQHAPGWGPLLALAATTVAAVIVLHAWQKARRLSS